MVCARLRPGHYTKWNSFVRLSLLLLHSTFNCHVPRYLVEACSFWNNHFAHCLINLCQSFCCSIYAIATLMYNFYTSSDNKVFILSNPQMKLYFCITIMVVFWSSFTVFCDGCRSYGCGTNGSVTCLNGETWWPTVGYFWPACTCTSTSHFCCRVPLRYITCWSQLIELEICLLNLVMIPFCKHSIFYWLLNTWTVLLKMTVITCSYIVCFLLRKFLAYLAVNFVLYWKSACDECLIMSCQKKKLSYHGGTAWRAVSVEILSTAAQLYENHIWKGLK